MTHKNAKSFIATLWFCWSALLFATLIVQTLSGKLGNDTPETWSWFLPAVMPTLSLVIGVISSDAIARKKPIEKAANKTAIRFALGLSAFYLLVVSLPVFGAPIAMNAGFSVMELAKRSNYWLAPVQGLTAGAIGVFFQSGKGK